MNLSNATIGQLMLPVADLERGIAFYRDVLGLPFLFAAPPQMAFFQCGALRLLIGVPPPGQRIAGGSAVYFTVPDIDAVHAELAGKGVPFQQTPHLVHKTEQSALWLAQFQDPDGNHLALMSEVPDLPGQGG
ncbi:VOC family protein [Massilia sp. CF038]|uniref:VOC family protein n=1 Tax=Massilia sp. CF038 TaxID=1881045 RepID=UPI00092346B1|nr:VOC family protein [Massilia sp. CF038]SHH29513.1 methylmalonyl-CoA epimerase [Massilia sp. CF038]